MATQPTDTSKPRLRAPGDELTVIAQRAQAFTNASGTAIALSEGSADEIICRARSGSAAPDVGAALRVEGSFTGLCIQTGKELRCDDAETDTRVDTAAIRALGIRSMVVTPIREDNKVIGVLACFAPTAHAFTITHVAVLKTMGDQISVLLQKERRAREEGGVQPSAPVPMPKPVASAVTPPPVVIKPAVTSSGPAAAAAVRSPLPVVSKVEPAKTEVVAPVPFPKREEKPRVEVRASFGTLDAVAGEDKKSGGSSVKFIGIAAVVAIAALSAFFIMRTPKSSGESSAQHAQQTATSSATAQPATQPGALAASSSPSVSGTPAATSTNNGPSRPSAVSSNSPAKPSRATNVSESGKKNDKSGDRNTEKNASKTVAAEVAEKPSPTPVAMSAGPSRISASAETVSQNTDVAPSFSVGSGNTPGALSTLAKPVGSGAPAVAQSDLEPMHVLKTVPPVYPGIARVRRLSGTVLVQVTVGKDGRVHNMQFMSGQPIFRDAAFDAVKQWLFRPAMLNGQPIEQTTQIKVDFKP